MANPTLSQAWVTKVTSTAADDVIASGVGLLPLPSEYDVAAVVRKAASKATLREIARRKWFSVPKHSDPQSWGDALVSFLFPQAHIRPALATAALFRHSPRQRDLVEDLATMAWLCRVTDKAEHSDVPHFDRAKLTPEALRHLVRLSTKNDGPQRALSYLETLGIRSVIESALPGMRLDGASFFAKGLGPVLGLTLRFDRLDSFWFTLMHEVAHIALHLDAATTTVFVDSLEEEDRSTSELEAEADAFAKDAFVPRDAWYRSEAYRLGTESAVHDLAEAHHIHAAIVAGRLRYERVGYRALTHLVGEGQVRQFLLAE